MPKPFLILQLRPEAEAADDEFAAILRKGGITRQRAHRIRLDQHPLPADLRLEDYAGVIVGGGPGCVSDAPEEKSEVEARIEAAVLSLMPAVTTHDVPFLGCCYGIGILGKHLRGEVSKAAYGEPVGTSDCALTPEGRMDLPAGCVHLVRSGPCPFQMVRHGRNVYATQFHPEADSDGFETRIRIYRHRGYFPPETADDLIAMCRAARVDAPERILRSFVSRYG
jgi:GMP synthase (glutamine-hydrolysing)